MDPDQGFVGSVPPPTSGSDDLVEYDPLVTPPLVQLDGVATFFLLLLVIVEAIRRQFVTNLDSWLLQAPTRASYGAVLPVAEPRDEHDQEDDEEKDDDDDDQEDHDDRDEDDDTSLKYLLIPTYVLVGVLFRGAAADGTSSTMPALRLGVAAVAGCLGAKTFLPTLKDFALKVLPLSVVFAVALIPLTLTNAAGVASAAMVGSFAYAARLALATTTTRLDDGHRLSIIVCVFVAACCLLKDKLLLQGTASFMLALVFVGLKKQHRDPGALSAMLFGPAALLALAYSAVVVVGHFHHQSNNTSSKAVVFSVVDGVLDVFKVVLLVRFSATTMAFTETTTRCIAALIWRRSLSSLDLQATVVTLAGVVAFVVASLVQPIAPRLKKTTARFAVSFSNPPVSTSSKFFLFFFF